MKYEYDATGAYFSYFVLCLLAIWLFPLTGYYVSTLFGTKSIIFHDCLQFPRTNSNKGPWHSISNDPQSKIKAELIKKRNRRTLANPQISYRFIFWLLGWIVFGFVVYKVATLETVEEAVTEFDPYQTLGISSLATEEDIKKAYKKLSLQWHPDKATEDGKENAEKMFIDISKAYRILTDEETRQAFLERGDPDKQQTFSYGIALPTWVVDPSNKYFVLAAYTFVFMILLPYLLSRWWSSSKNLTRDGVLNYTMGIYFQDLKEGMRTRKIMELLCASVEFRDEIPWRGERDKEAVMALFRKVKATVYEKTGDQLELPKKYNLPYCYKAFVLLHAHLFRVHIDDSLLLEDYYKIIPKFCLLAMKGIMSITSAHFWLNEAVSCLEISRMIIQAVPSAWSHTESSDFHQLPYFDSEKIKLLRNKRKALKSLNDFMSIGLDERSRLLVDLGFSRGQVEDVLAVARRIPRLSIETAKFVCQGEEKITPGCLITFILCLRASNLVSEEAGNVEKQQDDIHLTEYDSDDDEEPETSSNETSGSRPSRLTRLLSSSYWSNPNEPVMCPYFPDFSLESAKKPVYAVWLCNPRNNRVIGAPTFINNLVPNGTRTIKVKFQAPNQVGVFQFSVVVQSDSYVGVQIAQDVKMEVVKVADEEETNRAKTVKDAWKDLEEEERLEKDNLLGVQSAMLAQQNSLSKAAASDDETDWESTDSEDND